MHVTDIQIGESGEKFMQHYISTYQPEAVPPSNILLGVLIFIILGLMVTKIVDSRHKK